MTNLERVNQFLNETKVFFLSTADEDQPKTRPLVSYAAFINPYDENLKEYRSFLKEEINKNTALIDN